MARKPEVSLGLGLAVSTIVLAVHSRLPTQPDIRVGEPGDKDMEASRKQASWVAAGIVSGISLIAKDPTIFIIGGVTVIAMDWLTRVNNWNDPASGLLSMNPFKANMVETGEGAPVDSSYDGSVYSVA